MVLPRRNPRLPPPPEDGTKNYGHMLLELGLLYKAWLDLVKLLDRSRGIRLLKLTLVIFKAGKHSSKYGYEIINLLLYQLSVLSVNEAHKQFYAMFVNTQGKIDSHVACDDRMEWVVGAVKRHIRHMLQILPTAQG